MATEKYPLHSVRLDDEVWQTIKASRESLNQILRRTLNLDKPAAGECMGRFGNGDECTKCGLSRVDHKPITARDLALRHTEQGERGQPRKPNKRETAIRERAAGDVVAQAAERDDIDYSDVESTPTTHVATLDAVSPTGPVGKVSMENWRANRKPLLKPSARKEQK